MKTIAVVKGSRKYPILLLESKLVAEVVAEFSSGSQSVVVIVDSTVQALYPKLMAKMLSKLGKRAELLSLPSGERFKNGKHLLDLLESIISLNVDRSTTIVAVGGGVTTDMAGCVASLLLRGVRWVAVPTTFLGMVDAAIGGKTGVNSTQGKNLIGSFWPPAAVLVSAEFIRTQSEADFTASVAEAAKYFAIYKKPSLITLKKLVSGFPNHEVALAENIIRSCAKIKAGFVSVDEREGGVRAFLNFGHTIGHALEYCGGYRQISHGRAVAAGMIGAIFLSVKAGMKMTPAVEEFQKFCLELAAGKSVKIDQSQALLALVHDKKRKSGKLMFVLLKELGKPYVSEAPGARDLGKAVELSISALVNREGG